MAVAVVAAVAGLPDDNYLPRVDFGGKNMLLLLKLHEK